MLFYKISLKSNGFYKDIFREINQFFHKLAHKAYNPRQLISRLSDRNRQTLPANFLKTKKIFIDKESERFLDIISRTVC